LFIFYLTPSEKSDTVVLDESISQKES